MLTGVEIGMLIGGLQLAITSAPKVVELVKKAKEMITALFNAGLITKTMQDRLHEHMDAAGEAALEGRIPPALLVEPDPE